MSVRVHHGYAHRAESIIEFVPKSEPAIFYTLNGMDLIKLSQLVGGQRVLQRQSLCNAESSVPAVPGEMNLLTSGEALTARKQLTSWQVQVGLQRKIWFLGEI